MTRWALQVGSPGDILPTGQGRLCDSSARRKVNQKLGGDHPCLTALHLFTKKILFHHKNSQNSSFPGQTDWRAPSLGAQPCWRHALREAKLAWEVGGFSLRTTSPTHPVRGAAGGFELRSRLSGGQWGGPSGQ